MTTGSKQLDALLHDAGEVRRIAVEASCDPRTVRAFARREKVRGLVERRIREALVKSGYAVPEKAGDA